MAKIKLAVESGQATLKALRGWVIFHCNEEIDARTIEELNAIAVGTYGILDFLYRKTTRRDSVQEEENNERRKEMQGQLQPIFQRQMNRIIDALVHLLFNKDRAFVLIDGVLHGVVEQNPPVSMRKLVKYSFPVLMKTIINPRVKLRGENVVTVVRFQ